MEELELTYLAGSLPKGLLEASSKEIIDLYVPDSKEHPVLRIRKSGDKYEITKKVPIVEGDSSRQLETTILLTEEEFSALSMAPSKKVRKIRYYYSYNGKELEVDVFQDELKGLVLVDAEFGSVESKDAFTKPDFCLVEITQEKFIAGGMLCGKSYSDIEEKLNTFGYKKLIA